MIITPFFNRFLDNHIRLPAFSHAGPVTSDGDSHRGPVTGDGVDDDPDGPVTSDGGGHHSNEEVMGRAALAIIGAFPAFGVLADIVIALASHDHELSDHAGIAFCIGVPANLLGTAALMGGGSPAMVAAGAVGLAVSAICTATMPSLH